MLCGKNGQNYCLHISVRFGMEGYGFEIMVNTKLDGEWGTHGQILKNSVQKGEQFEIKIISKVTYCVIFVNGQDLWYFNYVVPDIINWIGIEADVKVQRFIFENA